MVFAVLYGYRHALELRLKDLVRLGVYCNELQDKDVEKALAGHSLCHVWQHVRPFLAKSGHCPAMNSLASTAWCSNFTTSTLTANPSGNDRQKDSTRRKFDNLPSHIGVETLRDSMDLVLEKLDTWYGGIYDYEFEGRQAYAEGLPGRDVVAASWYPRAERK